MSKTQEKIDAAVDALKSNKEALKGCVVRVQVLPQGHIRLRVFPSHPDAKEGLIIVHQDEFPALDE